jgi:hypothetical protein
MAPSRQGVSPGVRDEARRRQVKSKETAMRGRWQLVTYFNLSLPNRPGELARFADQLHAEGVGLLGLWGYATGEDRPQLCCVPEVPGALRRWAKSVGLPIEEGRALYLHGENRPGVLVSPPSSASPPAMPWAGSSGPTGRTWKS